MPVSKMKNMSILKYLAALACAALIITAIACDELEVPYLVDEEEVSRYIAESDVALELFRTDSLILGAPYTMPGDDDAVYVDVIDSVRRQVEVYILINNYGTEGRDYLQDFGGSFGVTQSAEATVIDRFYVTTTRTAPGETEVFETERPLVRRGFFLKLGSDNQAFHGWLLLGYNGGGPAAYTKAEIITGDNTVLPADTLRYEQIPFILLDVTGSTVDTVSAVAETQYSYLWLNGDPEIGRLDESETVNVRAYPTLINNTFFTASCETDDGFIVETLQLHSDTTPNVTLTTPSDNAPSWNLIYLQEFENYSSIPTLPVPMDSLWFKGWCVPYRAED